MDHAQALVLVDTLQRRAQRLGVWLRPPPPAPTTCCGRGCNGCVWEGYFDAMAWWREDADEALQAAVRAATSEPADLSD